MKKLSYLLLVSVSYLLITSCVGTHQASYKADDNNLIKKQGYGKDNTSTDHSFNIYKHYVSSNVKYYNYQKYNDQGKILPVSASGASGLFAWDNNCLVFITVYGDMATPLLPYGITQWNSANKTLIIENTIIKMGDLVETNGTFIENLSNREGICWNYPYIVTIGVMGGIDVLKSEEDLKFNK